MIVCIHVHFGKNLIVIYGVAKVKLCPTTGAYYLIWYECLGMIPGPKWKWPCYNLYLYIFKAYTHHGKTKSSILLECFSIW